MTNDYYQTNSSRYIMDSIQRRAMLGSRLQIKCYHKEMDELHDSILYTESKIISTTTEILRIKEMRKNAQSIEEYTQMFITSELEHRLSRYNDILLNSTEKLFKVRQMDKIFHQREVEIVALHYISRSAITTEIDMGYSIILSTWGEINVRLP